MQLARMVRIGLILLGAAPAMEATSQVVYKYVDDEGRTVFTDRPPEDAPAEVLALPEEAADDLSAAQVRERTQRMLENADTLAEDRIAREQDREAEQERRRAMAEAAERDRSEPESEPTAEGWYPVYGYPWLRPPHGGHRPPGYHPGRPPWPPWYRPPEHLPEPPPPRPPGGRITPPRQPWGGAVEEGFSYGRR